MMIMSSSALKSVSYDKTMTRSTTTRLFSGDSTTRKENEKDEDNNNNDDDDENENKGWIPPSITSPDNNFEDTEIDEDDDNSDSASREWIPPMIRRNSEEDEEHDDDEDDASNNNGIETVSSSIDSEAATNMNNELKTILESSRQVKEQERYDTAIEQLEEEAEAIFQLSEHEQQTLTDEEILAKLDRVLQQEEELKEKQEAQAQAELQQQQQQQQQRITASSGRTTRTTTVVGTTRTVITPTCTIPKWTVIKPLVVASLSVFARSFMLQLSIAGAAAMATRGGSGSGGSSSSPENDQNHATSIAAHQIALQLWLLCSFICDALAAASQALVADRMGQHSSHGIRVVSRIIFRYACGLGMILAGLLSIGDGTGLLVSLFTKDRPTKEALQPLLLLLIVAQPLNSLVFAADGVLQGASAFTYQAKSMVLSVLVAMGSFYCLTHYYAHYHNQNKNKNSNTDEEMNLVHVWYSLLILQLMRGITSLWKLVQPNGPIDLFHRRVVE